MRPLRIVEAAVREAEEATAWYERECPGLGVRFAAALENALERIERDSVPLSPLAGRAGRRGAKRLILKRFPYDIVVLDHGDARIVVAFAHHARKPGYWQGRISSPAGSA